MDNLQKFISQVRGQVVVILLLDNLIVLGDWWLVEHVLRLSGWELIGSLVLVAVLATSLLPWLSARTITQPTRLIWQAILHIAPEANHVAAPNLTSKTLGHDLVVSLVGHIYQLAQVMSTLESADARKPLDLHTDFIANNLPLPLIVLDKTQTVLFANKGACDYLQQDPRDVIGHNVYSIMDMSFDSQDTFDSWLQAAKGNAATATKMWEHVHVKVEGGEATERAFDLAAYYNAENPQGFESLLVLFDHTASYKKDEQGLGFIALAVHELRTPVTLLRGYIDVFNEELEGRLDAEMTSYLQKLTASAQSLSAFINTMLDVARLEGDQLSFRLHAEDWADIVTTAVHDLSLRAQVQNVRLQVQVAPNLPAVGVDRIGVYEVLTNLIDNAIKYSPPGAPVIIKAELNTEGQVETTVQDFGNGIPTALIDNLFEKFYRSHRSRDQVAGTGLGLYLSKAIIAAHGGHIWVRSREGFGSTFGFTVSPYDALADEQKTGNNEGIVRGAHGWIKNHSLYSR